ncbi:MAG: MFS transporter [Deltaproteobacteria bacterium]|nr:MFS transporter [Deltaproteobacteria bacterium]
MEKLPIIILFLSHLWVDGSLGILPVIIAKMKEVFGLSYLQAGLFMTIMNVTSSVIQPGFGYITDRFKLGWFIPVGMLWTSVIIGLIGWSPDYLSALIIVGLSGFGTAAFHPCAMTAVYLVSGTHRGLGSAVFNTGGHLGFALGPVIGSFLIFRFGLHGTIGLMFPALLLFFFIFFYSGDLLHREEVVKSNSGSDSGKGPYTVPYISITIVCLIITIRSWIYISFLTYLPMFFQTRGVHLKTGSLMLTTFLIGGAIAGLYGGHLSDQIGRRKVVAVSMILFSVITSLFLISSGPLLWVLVGASGAALLASFSVTIVMAQELLPHRLGLASGLALGLGFGTGGLGAALSGYLSDMFGLYTTFWILTLVSLLGALLAAMVKTRPQIANDGI